MYEIYFIYNIGVDVLLLVFLFKYQTELVLRFIFIAAIYKYMYDIYIIYNAGCECVRVTRRDYLQVDECTLKLFNYALPWGKLLMSH